MTVTDAVAQRAAPKLSAVVAQTVYWPGSTPGMVKDPDPGSTAVPSTIACSRKSFMNSTSMAGDGGEMPRLTGVGSRTRRHGSLRIAASGNESVYFDPICTVGDSDARVHAKFTLHNARLCLRRECCGRLYRYRY